MRKLLYDDVIQILENEDIKRTYKRVNIVPDESKLKEQLENYIELKSFERRSVLGIDIYQYSAYLDFEQTFIPVIFKILFEETIDLCLTTQTFLFQKYSKKRIKDDFINTGDGGFFIFDTPLHAIIFACNFEITRRAYNSFHLYPKLRKIIGGISLRFAITYDKIYYFDNNYYGRAIINNARILSKDNLNRCLIDQGSHEWFLTNIDGVENLQIITKQEIANVYEFQEDYDKSLLYNGISVLFQDIENSRNRGIINSDISKIGTIKSKHSELNIYNVHIQICIDMQGDKKEGRTKRTITVSLGNLNTTGIS